MLPGCQWRVKGAHAHAYPLCAPQTRRRESTANELADVTAALRGARAEAEALRGRLAAAIADGAWHRVASPSTQRPPSLARVGTCLLAGETRAGAAANAFEEAREAAAAAAADASSSHRAQAAALELR